MIVDSARLEKARPAPGGGVVVPARIGRDGVQLYRRLDGSTIRAYRPADEVRAADYSGAPVTIGHPAVGVSPANWREHSVGLVRQQTGTERVGSREFVRADLQIADAKGIAGVQSGEITECSCAYTCKQDWTAGVTADGEAYDVVFRALVPNHVALGGNGFARAGADAKLMADGETPQDVFVCDSIDDPVETSDMVDQKVHDALVADHATLKAQHATLKAELDATKGKLAAAETKNGELQAKADGLPKAITDGVAAELAFRKTVAPRLPADYVFDGKSQRDVKVDAIKHYDPKVKVPENATDAWLDGYLAGCPARRDANAEHRPVVVDGATDYQAHMRTESARLFRGAK